MTNMWVQKVKVTERTQTVCPTGVLYGCVLYNLGGLTKGSDK